MLSFRIATPADLPAGSALWAYAFEQPGDPFFDWYFGKNFRPESVLLGETEGHIATALHLHPHTLMIRGKKTAADYIVGVATHPAARRRGAAKALLSEAFHISKNNGRPVQILMPSAAPLYRKLGFGFYVFQWEREALPRDISPISETPARAMTLTSKEQWPILAGIYDAFTAPLHGYTGRDAKDWARLIESTLAGGHIAVVFKGNTPSGYLFYNIENQILAATEMVYTDESSHRALYGYMAAHDGQVETCRWYEPFCDKSFYEYANGALHTYIQNRTFPFMMARITDPAAAFTGIETPDIRANISFHLTDPDIPENTGNYLLTAENGRMTCTRSDAADISITPAGAAQLLTGALSARDLVKFGNIKNASEGNISLLDALFPPKDNWINEWY